MLERALQGEMTEHLGYAKNDIAEKNTDNARNGSSAKNLKGEFGPPLIKKHQTRSKGVLIHERGTASFCKSAIRNTAFLGSGPPGSHFPRDIGYATAKADDYFLQCGRNAGCLWNAAGRFPDLRPRLEEAER